MSFSHLLQNQFVDILTLPRLSSGVLRIWSRNFLFFRYKWLAGTFWSLFEPLLYLLAIGLGLGQYVGQIEGVPYLEWFYPGLVGATAMLVSFSETTYGSFQRLYHQNTYKSALFTPISSFDVVLGEILWASSKGFFSALGVGVLGATLIGFPLSGILPAFLYVGLIAWVFAGIGMMISSYASHFDSLIYAQSALIVPMYLLSGTYFPVAQMPKWLQWVAWTWPLTHGVAPLRALLLGELGLLHGLNALVLLTMALISTNWSTARLHRQMNH